MACCGGMGMGPWMMLLWALLLLGVVGGAILLVRVLWPRVGTVGGRPGEDRPAQTGALDILEERYARGEIDQKEFEERRRQLQS